MLLTRDRAAVYAVGGTCPHAGGKLAEGVRHNDHVICPWHKASFCLRTGALLDPPAMDALPRFATRVAQGRVFVSMSATKSGEPPRAKRLQVLRHRGGGSGWRIGRTGAARGRLWRSYPDVGSRKPRAV